MKSPKITVRCADCGNNYECARSSYDAIRRENRPFRCHSCMLKYRSKMMSERNASRTEEQKAAQYKSVSDKKKAYWRNMGNTQERAKWMDAKVNPGRKKWFENQSEEERKRISKAHSESNRRRHAAKTPEQLEAEREAARRRWQESSQEFKDKHSQHSRDMWANESSEKRAEHSRKIIANASSGKKDYNSLDEMFVNMFNHSHLVNEYYCERNYPVIVGNATKHWDFALFNDNTELIAVVDLDGARYHGDKNEYDGLFSKEEYDERRPLFVPDGVKQYIIREGFFAKDFEILLKGVFKNYDEYLDDIFTNARRMPFPFPRYSSDKLVRCYLLLKKMNCDDENHKQISLNTRNGDWLIQHFHPSIYNAHVRNSPSPYDAWYDDDLLKKCIVNRTIYQTNLNGARILQGFNVSKIAPKVSVFSAGRAKMIISKYLSEFNTVFDPFSGFSGRMLGTISLDKRYIGQDISEIHVRESNQMIEFLHSVAIQCDATVICQDILSSTGEYQCLFTCPPYGDKEQWQNVPVDRRTCDEWIDICLDHFKCKRYVFVVDETTKYKSYIVDDIRNKSHLGSKTESLIVIDC